MIVHRRAMTKMSRTVVSGAVSGNHAGGVEERQRRRASWAALLVLVPLGVAACGGGPSEDIVSQQSGLGLNIIPQGLTCGVAYKAGSNHVVDGTCFGFKTIDSPVGTVWPVKIDGDSGAPSGTHFTHQYNPTFSPSYDTRNLVLPQGAVCGLQRTNNSPGLTCIGKDPRNFACPDGWTWRFGNDAGSDGLIRWVWCEYNDDMHNCPNGSCLGSMPQGMACGMTDTDLLPFTDFAGRCGGCQTGGTNCPNSLGQNTQKCPNGFVWSYATPPNSPGSGFYDAGRPAGQGLGWCRKL